MKELLVVTVFIMIASVIAIWEFPYDKQALQALVIVAILMWQNASYKNY